ncbi:sialidase family protein [Jiangella asiatica]|uniref:exo-alpha-sialidase n=1 Tax=Jiangella asiatica TaxID=2530372 RepID=A0A4R5CNZ0_9ACTN|nr:sialidase family protein [Jiangella asiatica]TDE01020.1 exo-alpha-sialidase [Jiangella asiatica]
MTYSTKLKAALALILVGGATAAAPAGAQQEPAAPATPACTSTPFVSGTDGYHTFRIPATIVSPSGEVLAFAEGRVDSASDTGDIDIVLRRSDDGGCTWSDLEVVADLGADTIGNPTPVVDPESGDIVLLSTFNLGTSTEDRIKRGLDPARTAHVQRSSDGGRTWSEPEDIAATTRLPSWRWYATGPGHAIALTSGPDAGRLVAGANHSLAPADGSTDIGTEAQYLGGHSLISDDGGLTWRIGFVADDPTGRANANETTLAQLPDGRVYLNSRKGRNSAAVGNRLDTYSPDGAESLDRPYVSQGTLWQMPACAGSVLQTNGTGSDQALFFTGPSNPGARSALSIRRSDDGGLTFEPVLTLSGLPAAYSDLVQLDRDTIGVMYETGNFIPSETITFRRVPLRDLRS